MLQKTQIFFVFFRVGALTLGGGLAMISVLRHELVVKRRCLSVEDFAQAFTAATSLPGAIFVNIALLSGYRMCGAAGAAAAFLGAVLPSFIAIVAVAMFLFPHFRHPVAAAFLRGAAASVAGLLAHTAITMCAPVMKRASHIIFALVAAAIALTPGVNPIFALLIVSAAVFLLSERKPS